MSRLTVSHTTVSVGNFNNFDHGLRMPNKAFWALKSRTFGLGLTYWAVKFWGIWGIFGQTISTHFATVSPFSMFSIIQPLLKN